MSKEKKKQWLLNRPAQPVADLVSKLLNPVIERRAGMTMDLISSWEGIVGQQHADHSRPEKLRWPRQASDDDPFEPATLVVACEGGHAVFMQHDSSSIISRVNTYFGFAAVARLKFVQKPITRHEQRVQRKSVKLSDQKNHELQTLLQDVSEPKLKAALEKMGTGVFSKGSAKKK